MGLLEFFVSQGRIHCYHPLYQQLKEAPQLLHVQEDPLGLSGPYYNGYKRKHRYFSFLLVKYQLLSLQQDPLRFCFTISSGLSGPYYKFITDIK